uniref:hypothetical protein n=1 Tax=Laurencia catarinensis TaxID=197326 RepID=UPI0028D1FB1A|nr:hypothetical protein RU987_pgp122 [Laurencia catarinensis]WMP12458.1 hypothetical protein [Laurencia catarinensis]
MIHRNNFFIARYSYSPITQYHRIKPYFKVHYIFSVLLFAPYINSNHIINFILITFSVVEISGFRKLLYSSNLNKVKLIVLVIYYITFMNQSKIYYNTNFHNVHKKFFVLKLTYFLKTSLLNLHKNTVDLKHYFILLRIPNYILKLIFIYIMFNNGLNILYLCTKYENIVEIIIVSLNNIKKN